MFTVAPWPEVHLKEIFPLDEERRKLYEDILTNDCCFATEELFAAFPPEKMTIEHMKYMNFHPYGLCIQIQKLHLKLHTEYLARRPPTWLTPRLTAVGLDTLTIAGCEKCLIDQEKLITEELFAELTPAQLTNETYSRMGITAVGVQSILRKIHSALYEERLLRKPHTWWAPHLEEAGLDPLTIVECEAILFTKLKYTSLAAMRKVPLGVLQDHRTLCEAGFAAATVRFTIREVIEKLFK